METYKELDVIELTGDVPELNLVKGQTGTIVLVYNDTDFEVEMSDKNGKTLFLGTLKKDCFKPYTE